MARLTQDRLRSIISDVLTQEQDTAYQEFFRKALEKYDVSSPDELDGEKKKEFFDYVDANWDAPGEKAESKKFTREDFREMIREEYIKLTEGKNALWRIKLK